MNINTPAILGVLPELCGYISYATEKIDPEFYYGGPEQFSRKTIRFVFHRQVLVEAHLQIKSQIEVLLRMINDETEMIQGDNLARGKIVTVADIATRREPGKNYWFANSRGLLCPVTNDSVPEYWGAFEPAISDFISDSESFPWMPVTISEVEDDIPF